MDRNKLHSRRPCKSSAWLLYSARIVEILYQVIFDNSSVTTSSIIISLRLYLTLLCPIKDVALCVVFIIRRDSSCGITSCREFLFSNIHNGYFPYKLSSLIACTVNTPKSLKVVNPNGGLLLATSLVPPHQSLTPRVSLQWF